MKILKTCYGIGVTPESLANTHLAVFRKALLRCYTFQGVYKIFLCEGEQMFLTEKEQAERDLMARELIEDYPPRIIRKWLNDQPEDYREDMRNRLNKIREEILKPYENQN